LQVFVSSTALPIGKATLLHTLTDLPEMQSQEGELCRDVSSESRKLCRVRHSANQLAFAMWPFGAAATNAFCN
jgi:hypothetical protein